MIKLVKSLFYKEAETKQALCDFISRSSQLSIGEQCAGFEQAFAQYQGRRHAVLFNSGSSANLALIQALLNIKALSTGDRAAFSAITWATNVMPLMQLGLTPTPVDIELATLNVSSQTFLSTLKQYPDIRILFLTNLLGFSGDLDAIQEICRQRNILLIEDNCESLGSVYQGKKLGNWSLASTFSFFVGHHVSTIEGGAVCTDDPVFDRMLRLVRAHGWDRNLTEQARQEIREEHGVQDSFFANYTFYTLGYNLRPTEITGFLGNNQLPYFNEIVLRRQDNFRRFEGAVARDPDLIPLQVNHLDTISNFAMPIICRTPALARDYIQYFHNAGVEIRPIVGGSVSEQPFYVERYGKSPAIHNARLINHQGFYFGNNPELTEAEVEYLCTLIAKASVRAPLPQSAVAAT